jgi:threonine aldolase
MSEGCDFDLAWLAHHCDVFYIGGTKQGALCGEAVVFPQHNAPRHFFNIVKQHGALLAKSRLAGVQFDALFTDNLYFDLSKHAINKAMQLRQLFIEAGITIKDSPTNQQFVVLSHDQQQQLMSHVLFETWEPVDDTHNLCRFVTSWATTEEDMKALENALHSLK